MNIGYDDLFFWLGGNKRAHPSILTYSKSQDPVDWLGNVVVDIDPGECKLIVEYFDETIPIMDDPDFED